MKAATKGGHPLPGSLLTLISAKLLVQDPWPIYMWSLQRETGQCLLFFPVHALPKHGIDFITLTRKCF